MTNADKIRAMTDEELARLMCSCGCCSCPHIWDGLCTDGHNANLDWLKQEAKDGN